MNLLCGFDQDFGNSTAKWHEIWVNTVELDVAGAVNPNMHTNKSPNPL